MIVDPQSSSRTSVRTLSLSRIYDHTPAVCHADAMHARTLAPNDSLDGTVLVFSELVSPSAAGEMFSGEDILSLLWPVCISYICNGGERVDAVQVNLTPLISGETH